MAVFVGEQLDLDVAGPLQVALEEEGLIPECALGLAPGRRDGLRELGRLADDSHPSPAAARGRLDHQRKANLFRLTGRQNGDAGGLGRALRFELVATAAERFGCRAHEDEPGRLHRLGEVGVLGQEPVAGMNSVRAFLLRGTDVLLGLQIARDLDYLAGFPRVQRAPVIGRDDSDGLDPLGSAGAEDSEGDLAAVGYKELPDL